jgi:hypothetical protein
VDNKASFCLRARRGRICKSLQADFWRCNRSRDHRNSSIGCPQGQANFCSWVCRTKSPLRLPRLPHVGPDLSLQSMKLRRFGMPTLAVWRLRKRLRSRAADCGEYREAGGAFTEAVIRSVELIVQPDSLPGECYCFTTVNRKIAWGPCRPLNGHTLNLHSDHRRGSSCAELYWRPPQFS